MLSGTEVAARLPCVGDSVSLKVIVATANPARTFGRVNYPHDSARGQESGTPFPLATALSTRRAGTWPLCPSD
jgi:hypothetical protein